jgi:hypothetical protein
MDGGGGPVESALVNRLQSGRVEPRVVKHRRD